MQPATDLCTLAHRATAVSSKINPNKVFVLQPIGPACQMGKGRKKAGSKGAFQQNVQKKFDAFRQAKANPFDVQNNKRAKQNVLGKKTKGAKRNVSEAKIRSAATRDEVLLGELKQRGKVNTFVDKRFGENKTDVSQEEKDLARFIKLQSNRLQNKGKTKFNLSEGTDSIQLTHRGQAITARNFLGSRGRHDDDGEEDEALSADIVDQLHFGGGTGSMRPDGTKKTKEEIYAEIIEKSKRYKSERHRQKALDEKEMDALDGDLDDIRGLLDFKPSRAQERQEMMDRLASGEKKRKFEDTEENKKEKYSDFDSITRALGYEARAAATDAMKTDEQRAKEEKEKLEKLEGERLKRMVQDGALGSGHHERLDGDDLDVNYVQESGLQSSSSSSELDSDDDGEEDNDNQAATMGVSDETENWGFDPNIEVPYILRCPSNSIELKRMINTWCPPDRSDTGKRFWIVFSRVHKLTSIHLAAANRGKLGELFKLLLGFLSTIRVCPVDPSYFDFVGKTMYHLSQDAPAAACNAYADFLVTIQKRASYHTVRARESAADGGGGDYGLDDKKRRAWPRGGELVALKLLGSFFPVSDFRHPITTPANILLGQLLSQCPVRGPVDLAAGIFVASLQLYYGESARRLAPESINFLSATLGRNFMDSALFCRGKGKRVELEATVNNILSRCPPLAAARLPWLRAGACKKTLLKKSMLVEGDNGVPQISIKCFFHNSKKHVAETELCKGIIGTTCSLLTHAIDSYAYCPALPEMFLSLAPLINITLNVSGDEKQYPMALKSIEKVLAEKLTSAVSKCLKIRRPLLMQKEMQKPRAIQQYRPMFDEEYIVRKDNDPNKERAEIKQIKKQIARERKGTAREIRKDALYVAREKHSKDREWESETKKKYNSFVEFLNKQESGFKQMAKDGTGHGGGMKEGRRKKKVRAF